MISRLFPLTLPLLLAVAACHGPGAAEYTKREAPAQLHVDRAVSQLQFAFARGSTRLAPGESERLHHLVRSGAIRADDRVVIAPAGGPHLAEERALTISRELLRFGIVADTRLLTAVPADHALVIVGRYMVTLPACPNWSEQPSSDFSNERSSNFGCADATNLGLMVASPADLVSGEPLAAADATPAISAVDRYLTDKVTLPAEVGGAAALTTAPSGGLPTATSPSATQ
jgi:pilus assembly protein CpaD